MRLCHAALVAMALSATIFIPSVQGDVVIYNNIPAPVPPNVDSLGYQANQTAEFGGLIQFAGTARNLTQVTVLMSDWALASDYSSSDPTWSYPLTMNLYNVNNSGVTPEPGSLIKTVTQTFAIPWRPPASPGCGTAWLASDGNCYNGLAFEATFDFTGTTVPDQLIYGLAFNTTTWGYTPTGVAGPYESLNFGYNDVSPPSVGSQPLPDTAYWNTETAGDYTDGGAAGVGIFRQDTGWSGYSGAVSFDATSSVPEPRGTSLLLVTALLGMVLVVRRRRSISDSTAPRRAS
jgi:hypothetical protein